MKLKRTTIATLFFVGFSNCFHTHIHVLIFFRKNCEDLKIFTHFFFQIFICLMSSMFLDCDCFYALLGLCLCTYIVFAVSRKSFWVIRRPLKIKKKKKKSINTNMIETVGVYPNYLITPFWFLISFLCWICYLSP